MKKSKLNLTLPLTITFVLMVLVVIYTSTMFYQISVSNIYEVGADKISGTAANLGNYLDMTRSILWASADTVDFMIEKGASNEMILDYILLETQKYKGQFDENYTGIYGFIRGEYLDGLAWVPPEGYDPTQRDWYQIAMEADGDLAIVPPYVDAQTGQMVITVCRKLSGSSDVLALDLYITHVQEIIESTSIEGKGYGFIVDQDGTVVSHPDTSLNGTDFHKISGGITFMEELRFNRNSRFETMLDGKKCTVFTDMIMDQWNLVIAVENKELYHAVNSQLAVNIITNIMVFILIALFYSIAYRNEMKSSREAEALKISEQQKEYEAEILKLEKSAADSANRAKGEFLAQMSHEIRTPINAVLGMNEMILRETDDENILDYSRNIRTAGRTLLSLINSILDFSKIEDGKMEIVPVKYDTVSLINSLRHSVQERAHAKELEFVVNADPKLPRMLIGDDVRLTQVIVNLLTNAVKYTERGSVILDIRCRERRENHAVISVAVMDTGIGIRQEDMEKLFESFSRLEVTRNRNIEGTGLGMAIVTKLLTLMDSKLNVESEYGRGSVFSFEIRQEIADPEPIGKELERRTVPERTGDSEFMHYTGAKVLVTDDNEMNLKVAKNLLKLFDIKPDLAVSGAETVRRMRKTAYSIVFLDHMMPDMDGVETLNIMKEEDLIPEGTAVIALTANALSGAKERYLAAGFDDYLSKPISLDDLKDMLARYLTAQTAAPAEKPAETEDDFAVMEFSPDDAGEVMEFAPAQENGDARALDPERLAAAGFSAESGLKYCAGDADFYQELLRDYAGSFEKRMDELTKALDNEDWKAYETSVHALKSISKTLGADDVSELARAQEAAAKQGDAEAVRSRHGELKTLFAERVSALKKLLSE